MSPSPRLLRAFAELHEGEPRTSLHAGLVLAPTLPLVLLAAFDERTIADVGIWIDGAAALGTTSHFNVATPTAARIHTLMGVGAVTLTTAPLVFGISILRNRDASLAPSMRPVIGLGLVSTFVLTLFSAGAMSAMPGRLVGGNASDAEGLALLIVALVGFTFAQALGGRPFLRWLRGAAPDQRGSRSTRKDPSNQTVPVHHVLGRTQQMKHDQADHRLAENPVRFAHDRTERLLSGHGPQRNAPGSSCSLTELAACLGLGVRQFARAYRAATGTTPGARSATIRIERARASIDAGTGLAEAALRAGYGSQSHMTRRFVKALGMTPGEYRRRKA